MTDPIDPPPQSDTAVSTTTAPPTERRARLTGPHIVQLEDSDVSDDETPAGDNAPSDDFLADQPDDTEELHLQHLRLHNSSIPPLRLERFTQLKRLCLRQNDLESPLPELKLGELEDLDLYDNRLGSRVGDDEVKGMPNLT